MDADDLYGLPLDQFIPERTALARSLRSQGRREEAKEVSGTRKPSVAAWAVNQLVRTQARPVAELFEAGDALRAAQDQVLAGQGDRSGLRVAAERERQAVQELVKAARGLLSTDGHELGSIIVERVSETLHAAALDEEARQQVQAGTLQRELRHVGFGTSAGTTPAPSSARPRPSGPRPAAAKAAPSKEPARAQQRAPAREERRRVQRERGDALKAARTAEGEAHRAAQRAARALQLAQERRDRAAQTLDQAEQDLERARTEAQAAAEAQEAAGAELEQLSGGRDGDGG
jgi:hypothetical protein